jgi:hypothetical protein
MRKQEGRVAGRERERGMEGGKIVEGDGGR